MNFKQEQGGGEEEWEGESLNSSKMKPVSLLLMSYFNLLTKEYNEH